jgi:actin-related protein 10
MSSDSPPLASLAPAAPIRSRRTSLPSSDLPSTPAPRPRPVPSTLQTSPSYTSSIRSRHSLYGTEDRVVLDLGSRIWKYGFSGEGSPRGCQSVLDICAEDGAEGFWSLERGEGEGKEGEERLKRALRRVWFE